MRFGKVSLVGVLGLVLAGMCGWARGAEGGTAIEPYVDAQTLVVGRLNLDKVDVMALGNFVSGLLDASGVAKGDEGRKMLLGVRVTVDAYVEEVKGFGVHEVYGLVSHPDAWPAMEFLCVVIPVAGDGNVAGLVGFLKSLPLAGAGMKVEMLSDHVVYVGQEIPLMRLRGMKAAARPELVGALGGSGAALTVVGALTGDARRVVGEMMPALPVEVGGGSTEFISRDLVNVVLGVELPPTASVMLRFNMKTGESAERVAALGKKGLEVLRGDAGFVQATHGKGELAPYAKEIEGLMAALTPTVVNEGEGHAAVVRLGGEEMKMAATLMMPDIGRAREQAMNAKSMSNLKQIALGCYMYRADWKGAWPGSLDVLVETKILNDAKVLVDPRDKQGRRYVLEPWTTEQIKALLALGAASVQVPVAYEPMEEEGTPIAVAFLDGHVEMVENRGKLREMLTKAEEASGK